MRVPEPVLEQREVTFWVRKQTSNGLTKSLTDTERYLRMMTFINISFREIDRLEPAPYTKRIPTPGLTCLLSPRSRLSWFWTTKLVEVSANNIDVLFTRDCERQRARQREQNTHEDAAPNAPPKHLVTTIIAKFVLMPNNAVEMASPPTPRRITGLRPYRSEM